MENALNFRALNENDYKTIKEWWKWWKWSVIPKDSLPDNGKGGFMVEKNNQSIVCGFLYITNSKVALLEWVVSNPEYKEKDRGEAIELLIDRIEEVCKSLNYKYIFTMGRNKHLIETHRKLGWVVDKKSSYEITKKL